MNNKVFHAGAMILAAACSMVSPATAQVPPQKTQAQNLRIGSSPAGLDLLPVLSHYSVLVHATYKDTLVAAIDLRQSVRAFVAAPSASTLATARQAWLKARDRYALTEAFRFYGGPIDSETGPEPRINSWPVDESFIDSVTGRPGAGIVNNPTLAIDRKTLVGVNVRDGEENVATGWHAIEFLLWGQDLSPTGPGDRQYTDYVDGRASNARRRGRYLVVVTDLLVDDLAQVTRAWAPDAANYRRNFEREGEESLRRLIVGMGMLTRSELAGERMEVPLASQDQEDEQSCFSDNTHHDIIGNAQGVRNVWLGRYTRLDGSLLEGPSLQDLVATRDPALSERLSAQMNASVSAAQAIIPPFDREIVGDASAPGRLRVRRVIDSLVLQASSLVDAARALGMQRLNWTRKP